MVVMSQTRVARRSPTDRRISTLPDAAPSVFKYVYSNRTSVTMFIRVCKVIGLGIEISVEAVFYTYY